MSAASLPVAVFRLRTESGVARGWRRYGSGAEEAVLTLALAAVILLPLAEIAARTVLHSSVSAVHSLVQHFTLVLGILGGALAARDARPLSLSAADAVLKGRLGSAARRFSAMVAVTVTVFLFAASVKFVEVERAAGGVVAHGIPTWTLELALPVGFALLAGRIVRHAAKTWSGRLVVALAAAVLCGIAVATPLPPGQLALPALLCLLAAAILGAPIFTVLGGAALILFWASDVPIASVTAEHYRLGRNATLPAVPLFTLAGLVLAESGASRRLVRLFQALVGWFRGGPGVLVALVCAFFTAFTGASGVTILALGGLLMPVLLAARYSEKTALGLLTGTGSLGLLLPPCLPLILYAVLARVDITDMFLGGIIPGALLVAMLAVWAASQAPRRVGAVARFDWEEVRAAVWDAKWELLIPLVALGALFSGLATAVEAAALTAFYTLVVETLVHRELSLTRDVPRVMVGCGKLIGGLLVILGVALGLTNYLVDAEIPTRGVEWVTAAIHSRWMFLLLLNLFLIMVGALMDIYSALVVIVPLILPIGAAFGIDPIHLGIIFLANLELGYLTPPVGVNLFIAALRFEKPVATVFRSVVPVLIVFLIAVLVLTYVPQLTTALPRQLGR